MCTMLRCDLNRITMRGGLMLDYLFCVYVLLLPVPVISQCTLPASLRGTWVSSELGALNYTDDTIVAYPYVIPGTVESLDFQCQTHNATSFRYLLKATETFETFGITFDAYLCLELHQISSYKFWYHLGSNAMDSHLAEATCPFELLHEFANGSLTSADGTKACSNNSLDICTDRTDFRHVYDDSCDSSLMIAETCPCIIIVVCVIHKTRCRCLRRTKIASASTESSTVTLSIDELESCDENYYQKNITKDGIPLVVDTKDTRPTGGKRSLKKNILDKNNENVITIEESEDDRARKCNKRRAKKKSKGANNEAIEDQTQIKGKGHKRLQKGVLSVNDEEQTPESERDDIKNDGSGKKKSGAKKTADNKQRQGKSVAAKMKGKAGNVAREQGQEVEGDSDSGMGDLTIESNTGITSDEDASNRSDLDENSGVRVYSSAASTFTMDEVCARSDNRSSGEYDLLIKAAGGLLQCLYSTTLDYTYVTLYNNDTIVDEISTFRFTCMEEKKTDYTFVIIVVCVIIGILIIAIIIIILYLKVFRKSQEAPKAKKRIKKKPSVTEYTPRSLGHASSAEKVDHVINKQSTGEVLTGLMNGNKNKAVVGDMYEPPKKAAWQKKWEKSPRWDDSLSRSKKYPSTGSVAIDIPLMELDKAYTLSSSLPESIDIPFASSPCPRANHNFPKDQTAEQREDVPSTRANVLPRSHASPKIPESTGKFGDSQTSPVSVEPPLPLLEKRLDTITENPLSRENTSSRISNKTGHSKRLQLYPDSNRLSSREMSVYTLRPFTRSTASAWQQKWEITMRPKTPPLFATRKRSKSPVKLFQNTFNFSIDPVTQNPETQGIAHETPNESDSPRVALSEIKKETEEGLSTVHIYVQPGQPVYNIAGDTKQDRKIKQVTILGGVIHDAENNRGNFEETVPLDSLSMNSYLDERVVETTSNKTELSQVSYSKENENSFETVSLHSLFYPENWIYYDESNDDDIWRLGAQSVIGKSKRELKQFMHIENESVQKTGIATINYAKMALKERRGKRKRISYVSIN
ncbi:hypothetical protein MAR_023467 [Mya arenaria]|uniref:Uncharacterized protein n=1 Tax=Mya arenaria TaxID=6604 RepID=A0ABY7DR91_MYAAR|nr:hypothetical protein MAR_023467 [Mya arenaria]